MAKWQGQFVPEKAGASYASDSSPSPHSVRDIDLRALWPVGQRHHEDRLMNLTAPNVSSAQNNALHARWDEESQWPPSPPYSPPGIPTSMRPSTPPNSKTPPSSAEAGAHSPSDQQVTGASPPHRRTRPLQSSLFRRFH
ncbi:hypothetical protein Hypma_009772 [Hypsizygus marmoreus]|uniref:Uncharacterized protein n=1 Tax=Hypsizygus marmoreus TaxID=39966 RepID=A0A369JR91_HYPMA|nr:hypothetical protein Hypma_009772 [Hypsizygus marmoreus]